MLLFLAIHHIRRTIVREQTTLAENKRTPSDVCSRRLARFCPLHRRDYAKQQFQKGQQCFKVEQTLASAFTPQWIAVAKNMGFLMRHLSSRPALTAAHFAWRPVAVTVQLATRALVYVRSTWGRFPAETPFRHRSALADTGCV